MSISKLSNKDLLKYAETCQSAWTFVDKYRSLQWRWDGLRQQLYIRKNDWEIISLNIPPYSYFSTDEYTFFFYTGIYKQSIFGTDKDNGIVVLLNKNKKDA